MPSPSLPKSLRQNLWNHPFPNEMLASKEVFHAHFDLIFGSASLDRTRVIKVAERSFSAALFGDRQ